MPRLVVTLTMRPQRWRIMSWTTARDSAIGAFVVYRDEEPPLLRRDLPEFDRVLPVVAADRRLADPGIVDEDVDRAEPAARRRRRSRRPRRRASRSASIVSSAALPPPFARARRQRGQPLGGPVRGRDPDPGVEQPATSARPMPPAAPVTIAVRCLSLISALPFLGVTCSDGSMPPNRGGSRPPRASGGIPIRIGASARFCRFGREVL